MAETPRLACSVRAAQVESVCALCNRLIRPRQLIGKPPGRAWAHAACIDRARRDDDPDPLAARTRKARHRSACAKCGGAVLPGQQIGLIEPLGWCHLVPCVVPPTRPAAA